MTLAIPNSGCGQKNSALRTQRPMPRKPRMAAGVAARGFFLHGKTLPCHGFIGPIGDDFPSLIPLIFGLLMFFTSFTITFNSFDRANSSFNDDTTLLKISRTLQSNSYIFSSDNFRELCSEIGVVNLKFVAALTEDWVMPQPATGSGTGAAGSFGAAKNIFDVSIFKGAKGGGYFCSNQQAGKPDSISDFVSLEDVSDRRIVSRIFPIVAEDDKIVKPMHLVVVAWR